MNKTMASLPLPPPGLRRNHPRLKDDSAYLESSLTLVRELNSAAGLTPRTRLLDMGCGAGRLAFGLLSEGIEIQSYSGLDVRKEAVDWCCREITSRYPDYSFQWSPAYNERYAPDGECLTSAFKLPYESVSFECIAAFSLLTHLEVSDAELYLGEFRRLVTGNGCVFLTVFVEDGVPEIEINPGNFGSGWKGPLHCVRYERRFLENLFTRAGFLIQTFEKRSWQSYYVLCPARDENTDLSKSTGAS